ncbi:MAG: LacI family DNA-binding transcriptional regulator [Lysobacterales bacterium]
MSQVSIKDVARLAGVSIATVSRCLNDPERVREQTRARVADAIRRTGYSPNTLAQSFRRGKTQVIMVVLPSVGDPFFTEVMQGIRSVAASRGYSLLISETQFNTMTADEVGTMVVSRQADGIVLLASLSPFGTEVLSARSHRALPIVIGFEKVSTELTGFPSVHIDNVEAAREATNYLISLGHRRIAFIRGPHQTLLTRDRELGFKAAMSDSGLIVRDDWLVDGELTLPGAAAATRSLLAYPQRPTAIFCATDEMAMGCYQALNSAELAIPGDVSVVGFDDIRYAQALDPPLTTIRQPAREIGERVVLRLLAEIEQGRGSSQGTEVVPHRLVVRDSTAAPCG